MPQMNIFDFKMGPKKIPILTLVIWGLIGFACAITVLYGICQICKICTRALGNRKRRRQQALDVEQARTDEEKVVWRVWGGVERK